MPTRAAMKPLSPSPCAVGGSRTTDERTPREARESVIHALASRACAPPNRVAGAESAPSPSRSAATRPGARPGGDDDRPSRPRQRLAECLDGEAIRIGSALEAPREGDVVLEREVDHAIGGGSGTAQAVEVIKSAAMHLCSGRGQGSGRGIRAGEPGDLMARVDELGYDGGANPAGRTGDENAHEKTSRWSDVLGAGRARGPIDVSYCHKHSKDVSRCHQRRSGHGPMGATRAGIAVSELPPACPGLVVRARTHPRTLCLQTGPAAPIVGTCHWPRPLAPAILP